jgi:hypothetical protein
MPEKEEDKERAEAVPKCFRQKATEVIALKLMVKRLKGDGEAVGLKVDEVAVGIAGLAAGGDVGAAGLLDGDGDCWFDC